MTWLGLAHNPHSNTHVRFLHSRTPRTITSRLLAHYHASSLPASFLPFSALKQPRLRPSRPLPSLRYAQAIPSHPHSHFSSFQGLLAYAGLTTCFQFRNAQQPFSTNPSVQPFGANPSVQPFGAPPMRRMERERRKMRHALYPRHPENWPHERG